MWQINKHDIQNILKPAIKVKKVTHGVHVKICDMI